LGYSVPVGPGAFGVSASVSYNSGFYFQPDSITHQPSYALLNANISYSLDNFRFYLFGTNLTHKRYFDQVSPSTVADVVTYGAPLVAGGGVEWKFN
jgi:iron complex outermembrane receptor protein